MSNMVSSCYTHSVGSRIKNMRERLGLTRQELACAAGVSEKGIKLLERGVPVTLDFRRRVFKALWKQMPIREHILYAGQV